MYESDGMLDGCAAMLLRIRTVAETIERASPTIVMILSENKRKSANPIESSFK